MAYSYNEVGPKESGDTISVPFPFLDRDHVNVLVDGTAVSSALYSWVSDSLISCGAGFPTGTVTRVERNTPEDNKLSFQIGASVYDFEAVNLNDTQLIYLLQERGDKEDSRQTELEGLKDSLETYSDEFDSILATIQASEASVEADRILVEALADLSSSSANISFLQDGASAVVTTVEAKLRGYKNLTDFGVVGDGVADDTAAFRSAVAAAQLAGATLYHGASTVVRLTDKVSVGSGLTYIGVAGKSTIIPDLGPGSSISDSRLLFEISGSDVHFSGLEVDGSSLSEVGVSNHYIFAAGTAGGYPSRLSFRHVNIRNTLWREGPTGPGNLRVTHGFYFRNCSDFSVMWCLVDGVSGAGLYAARCSRFSICHNQFYDSGWYTVNLEGGNDTFQIGWNKFLSTDGIYYGGAINGQAQPHEGANSNGHIHDNDIRGKFGYGQAMRFLSQRGAVIERNIIRDWGMAATNIADINSTIKGLSAIFIGTRGVFSGATGTAIEPGDTDVTISITNPRNYHLTLGVDYPMLLGGVEWVTIRPLNTPCTSATLKLRGQHGTSPAAHSSGVKIENQAGPSSDIVIRDNIIYAPDDLFDYNFAILVSNNLQFARSPGRNIHILRNRIRQDYATGTKAFTHPIVVVASGGGLLDIWCQDNIAVSDCNATGVFVNVSGALHIGGSSDPSDYVANLHLGGNHFSDLGDGSVSGQCGLYLDYAQSVFFGVNSWNGYRYPLRNTVNVSKLYDPYRQVITNRPVAGVDYLFDTRAPESDLADYRETSSDLRTTSTRLNTTAKYAGKKVWCTDYQCWAVATGSVNTSPWKFLGGTWSSRPTASMFAAGSWGWNTSSSKAEYCDGSAWYLADGTAL